MDLTNYDVNTVGEGRGQVEPGRHVLHWQGEEEALIEGKNGWRIGVRLGSQLMQSQRL